jgi:hypothetical protein
MPSNDQDGGNTEGDDEHSMVHVVRDNSGNVQDDEFTIHSQMADCAVSRGGPEDVEQYHMESMEYQNPEWNFVLPVVAPSRPGLTNLASEHEEFDLRELVACMQNTEHNASLRMVHQYFQRFDPKFVKEHINSEVHGIPSMFYVVETNSEDMLRLWVRRGGDVSVVHQPSQTPLLAFAIVSGEERDTSLITATLLALGASPTLIPSAFYSPYIDDLPTQGPSEDDLRDLTDAQKIWCTEAAREKLARGCSLSQRYHLDRAARTTRPSRRQQQVAALTNAEPLLGISNFLIGQTSTAKALRDTLLVHLLEPSGKPLVLVFAGPSGHGKTELARKLGRLLSLDLEVVDCTNFQNEMQLFGPRAPYVGSKEGSQLNNFLAAHDRARSIVFMDEFEKTSSEIHKTLLLPFENGRVFTLQ